MHCSSPEVLAALVENRLGPSERLAVLDHAAACDDCRHALLILNGVLPAASARPALVRSWVAWAAAAAVFALSMGGLLLLQRKPEPNEPGTAAVRPIPERPEPRPVPKPRPSPPPNPPRPDPAHPVDPPNSKGPARSEEKPPSAPVTPQPPIPQNPPPSNDPAPAPRPATPEPVKPATLTVVAAVTRVEGEVFVSRGAILERIQAAYELRQGEGLETKGPRSWAVLSYPDHTRLEVEGDAQVREFLPREAGKGWQLSVDRGAVRAEVSKQPAGQAMVFHSPYGEARVIGTILRFKSDADPQKGARLEVEEGKVELRNAAGRSVLVEAGHVGIAAPGVALTSKRVPREEVLLAYDFEDGRKPASILKGTVQTGPDRRLCLAGESETGSNSHVFIGDAAEGLFTCTGDEVLSFDYWVDSDAGSVNLHFWNSTQKVKHETQVPRLTFGKWTHVTLRAAEMGDAASRLKEGDWVGDLYIQATGSSTRKFYVDNIVLSRPRSLRPKAAESK
jgi:hypothetical protein